MSPYKRFDNKGTRQVNDNNRNIVSAEAFEQLFKRPDWCPYQKMVSKIFDDYNKSREILRRTEHEKEKGED